LRRKSPKIEWKAGTISQKEGHQKVRSRVARKKTSIRMLHALSISMVPSAPEAMLLLFRAMITKGVTKILSVSLAFTFQERIVRLSSFGYIENQVKWLEQSFPLTYTEEGLTNWVEVQRQKLANYKINNSPNLMDFLVQDDGVLYIKRVPVKFPADLGKQDGQTQKRITGLQNVQNGWINMMQKLNWLNALRWRFTGHPFSDLKNICAVFY
jgi:hypothetical protein